MCQALHTIEFVPAHAKYTSKGSSSSWRHRVDMPINNRSFQLLTTGRHRSYGDDTSILHHLPGVPSASRSILMPKGVPDHRESDWIRIFNEGVRKNRSRVCLAVPFDCAAQCFKEVSPAETLTT